MLIDKSVFVVSYEKIYSFNRSYEWDGRNGKSGYADKVENLITLYLKTKDIDTCRIYICSASMGAQGTWKLLKDNPKLFAAGTANRTNS